MGKFASISTAFLCDLIHKKSKLNCERILQKWGPQCLQLETMVGMKLLLLTYNLLKSMFYIWRIGKESKKPRPERPIPPSAEAVARVRSQTLENLEEEENYPSDEAVNKIPGLFLCSDGSLLSILTVIISFLKT